MGEDVWGFKDAPRAAAIKGRWINRQIFSEQFIKMEGSHAEMRRVVIWVCVCVCV